MKKVCSLNDLTQSVCIQACSVPSPFITFVITVIVLVPVFLLCRKPSLHSDVAHSLFYLIGSTSCLHADNRIRQVLIYFRGTRLEPFSHNLAPFTSLHLWAQVLPPRSSQRLMASTQRSVSFIVRVPLSSARFNATYMQHRARTWRMNYTCTAIFYWFNPSTIPICSRHICIFNSFLLGYLLNGCELKGLLVNTGHFLRFQTHSSSALILFLGVVLI